MKSIKAPKKPTGWDRDIPTPAMTTRRRSDGEYSKLTGAFRRTGPRTWQVEKNRRRLHAAGSKKAFV